VLSAFSYSAGFSRLRVPRLPIPQEGTKIRKFPKEEPPMKLCIGGVVVGLLLSVLSLAAQTASIGSTASQSRR
jgi:hypothetical protein